MPKNTQGGKKFKQQKHKNNDSNQNLSLSKPTEGQDYAVVTKLLGNSQVLARFYDTREKNDKRMNEIICYLRPGLKKKRQFAKIGSILIISLRDFEKNKGDVIYVYSDEDVKRLKRKDLLHENLIPIEDSDDEFKFQEEKNLDSEYESDEEEKVKEIKQRGDNICIQDFGLPPANFDDDDNIDNN